VVRSVEAIQKFKQKWDADVIYLRWKKVYEDAVIRAIYGQYFTFYIDSFLDYICNKYNWKVWMRGRFFLFCRKWLPRLAVDSQTDKEAMRWDWEDWGFPPEEFDIFWDFLFRAKEIAKSIREIEVTKNFGLFGSIKKVRPVEMEVVV
jgi:hypothetical protein